MNTLHTWNMTIDSVAVIVEGLADDNIMLDFPRVDENIFTAYGQEDFLMCSLFEGGDIADGAVLEYAIIKDGEEFYITWADHVAEDDELHRLFNLTMHTLTKS